MSIRLNKLMSELGISSRREADVFIEKGWVLVDGEVIDNLGTKVSPDSNIELLDPAQQQQNQKVTIILNKPIGFVSTQPEKGYRAAIELITHENQDIKSSGPILRYHHLKKLGVVGRLDIDSQGLLLFTQDGRLAKKIIGEKSSVEKEYIVRFIGDIDEKKIDLLRYGLRLDGKMLKPAKVDVLNKQQLRFVLTEGKKRQVRRMGELVGLEVTNIKRVRIGNIRLENLPIGKWCFLIEKNF